MTTGAHTREPGIHTREPGIHRRTPAWDDAGELAILVDQESDSRAVVMTAEVGWRWHAFDPTPGMGDAATKDDAIRAAEQTTGLYVLTAPDADRFEPEPCLEPADRDGQIVCPHCYTRGKVRTRPRVVKRGISGGKATAAVLTGGLSILGTGLSRKQHVTEAACSNCGQTWTY